MDDAANLDPGTGALAKHWFGVELDEWICYKKTLRSGNQVISLRGPIFLLKHI